ncbi:glycoside hydrolase family 3 N-terminal domain-containing protein [Actinomyces sp. MRS3W]|uniref:glycoside hydrolase family 3 N-terminal domain-containing protein n=1 Tax=Actinomyces sp. MRS3W TaxID=2800796 RepID=UPI0028FD777F|nr:glycoside hydrolase family 3 N-terminal domain-containing protein [Actinomyces sp. MRS3W]MDU0349356.1 glycoside hydrolase family 3 N-terminal domain-containing protein [Actinomyces sp. MRS3W]
MPTSSIPDSPSAARNAVSPVIQLHPQHGGPTLGTTSAPVMEVDGHLFKDLARTGELLPYEDWRLPAATRAADVASRLSIEAIAGLMLYSPHQPVPNPGAGPFAGTYGGRPYPEAGVPAWALTDQQITMVTTDRVRHVLVFTLQDADTAARWNNAMQALAESEPLGVPVNTSTDPRNGAAEASGAEFATAAADVSRWPEGLGMAALFDAERVGEYAAIISREYRALGITTALGPQIDIATDPRWMRLQDTWGPHSGLVCDYTRAYCDGMQTTESGSAPGAAFGLPEVSPSVADAGWGSASVATMVKHWPGGGTGEGGRDAHYGFGKFAVYPGGNEAEHLRSFVEAAFHLDGPTGTASAVMPYYTISWNYRTPDGRLLNTAAAEDTPRANAYNRAIVHDMLRQRYGFDGVVCTDWGITADPDPEIDHFGQRCYGVEDLDVAGRHRLAIDNGVDQFGGNSEAAPIMEAYRRIAARDGEAAARVRFEASAARLLRTFFRAGLFENPYLDPDESTAIVGCDAFTQAARAAQRDSLVLLKNGRDDAVLPLGANVRHVWVPTRHVDAQPGFMRLGEPARDIDPFNAAASPYTRATRAQDADAAVVFIESPISNPYAVADREAGGNGYLPISLQYRPYTATTARASSLASGDFRETGERSYRGKTNRALNASDLDAVIDARRAMGERPVIVVVRMHNPAVLAELEPYADAIVVDFGVQQEIIWELLAGRFEPSGLLPVTLPASMEAVEAHCEDLPFDYQAYTDAAGHTYAFGYGLNWSGVIDDERTGRYTV